MGEETAHDDIDSPLDFKITENLYKTLQMMKDFRDGSTGDGSRYCSIAITDLEKVIATWAHWVVGSESDAYAAAVGDELAAALERCAEKGQI